MSVADRLRRLREAKGYDSAAEAARAHNWNQSTYRAHENGQRGVPAKWLATYAKAYGSSLAWLSTGTEDAYRNEGLLHIVPVIEWSSLPKGGPVSVSSLTPIAPAQSLASSVKLGETVRGLPVRDDSMTSATGDPQSLLEGDHVVVNFNARIQPGKLALIYDNHEKAHCIRRAEYIDRDTIRFVALNPVYPAITLKASSRDILGAVVQVQRSLA